MKAYTKLNTLQIGIVIILVFHILYFLVIIRLTNIALRQTGINTNDLEGATKMYYHVNFGNISKSFEFIFDVNRDAKGVQLYHTEIGYLELKDKNADMLDLSVLPNKSPNEKISIPVSKSMLVLPVTKSQKRNLIFLATGISALMILYSFMVFIQLKRFIRSLMMNDPFTNSNIRLLYSIGLLILAVPLIKYALEAYELSWIRRNFSFEGYAIISNFSFQFYLFGIGILILAITETLRQSVNMKKEQALTI